MFHSRCAPNQGTKWRNSLPFARAAWTCTWLGTAQRWRSYSAKMEQHVRRNIALQCRWWRVWPTWRSIGHPLQLRHPGSFSTDACRAMCWSTAVLRSARWHRATRRSFQSARRWLTTCTSFDWGLGCCLRSPGSSSSTCLPSCSRSRSSFEACSNYHRSSSSTWWTAQVDRGKRRTSRTCVLCYS